MEYRGRHNIFDQGKIKTYPVAARKNKVRYEDLIFPDGVESRADDCPGELREKIGKISDEILSHRKKGNPVIVFTGAHLVKNGLGPLLLNLIHRKLVTLVAGNGATSIHDFELALMGETSEYVPDGLGTGLFGMAQEFGLINAALRLGEKQKLGYGEAIGYLIREESFRKEAMANGGFEGEEITFACPEASIQAECHDTGIPFTVHAGIGTDVIDQHDSFDGSAKGGCSGRDFLIFVREVTKLVSGGVILNIGSAVQGPEVFLKALSMAANSGARPSGIVTADFDIRAYSRDTMSDEGSSGYYFRDQKSIVTRIPEAFSGEGYYVQGDQRQTIPFLFQCLLRAGSK